MNGSRGAETVEVSGRTAEERDREMVCAAACAGIPTAELEAGVLLDLVAACFRYKDDARIRGILERLAPPPARPLRLLEGAPGRLGRGAANSRPTSIESPAPSRSKA